MREVSRFGNDYCTVAASQTKQALTGPNGGGVTRVSFAGRYYAFDTQGSANNQPVFVINNPAHVDGSQDINITGTVAGANGGFFECQGTNMNVINIHGMQIQNYGLSPTAGPNYLAYLNCPNAYVMMTGNTAFSGVFGSNNHGIAMVSGLSGNFTGNTILATYDAFAFPGMVNPVVVTGNIVGSSQDTYSVPSTFGQNVAFGVNKFDKLNPTLGQFKTPLPGSCAGLPSGTWWSNTLVVSVCP